MVDCKPDFILQIQQPLLSQAPPGDSVEVIVVEPIHNTKWRVFLRKAYDFLKVDVKCLDIKNRRINGEYMHFIPKNGGKPVTFTVSSYALENCQNASMLIHAENFLHDGHYEFYIIQTEQTQLPHNLRIPDGNKSPPAYEESTTAITKDMMSSLLCDIYSVDTYFVFGPTRATAETCLWAHRTILAKYPAFDVLIKQALFAYPKTGAEPISMAVTKVSLAAFAALLNFMYTGEIQRINYPEHFAISKSAQWTATTSGGYKDSHWWYSMDLGTPLSAEPVTWQELLDAATIYKVEALRARCETALKIVDKVNITRSSDAE
ncbi:hypothetical protein BGZ81_003572 [Podila clonocystis]|nr:hypothetical protein BGZ81_003572 [Podila clonocystis]